MKGDNASLHEIIKKLDKRVDEILYAHEVRENETSTEVLAHFTDLDALMRMLNQRGEAGEEGAYDGLPLYLSDTVYLNDPLEGKALFGFAENIVPVESGGAQDWSRKDVALLRSFIQWLKKPNLKNAFPNTVAETDIQLKRTFVCSFTSRCDELDLWRAYGSGGEGVCLAMNLRDAVLALKGPELNDSKWKLYRVKYSSEEKMDVWRRLMPRIRDIMAIVHKGELSGQDGFTKEREKVSSILGLMNHLYKHEQYRSEGEIRLLFKRDIGDNTQYIGSGNSFEPLKIQVNQELKRAFCYTPPFMFSRGDCNEIVLGPVVDQRERIQLTVSALSRQIWGNFAPRVLLSVVPYQ